VARENPDRKAPEEVDAYLAALPEDQRAALQTVREMIHEIAPEATERIAYRIIVFRLGKDLVALSAHTRHVALHTLSPALAQRLATERPDITVSGATVHFTPARPLPRDVVETVVRRRMEALGGDAQG
jgi:uncharacterized protein YdhG (YjbR/CyaY superfamily)